MAGERLLVVDDHPVNRKLAAVLLRDTGWTCEQAGSGGEALALLARERYDCVLLDISMPDMSGDDVCRRIRADARLAGLRVVAYTAHTTQEEQRQILEAGFDAMLVKPVSRANLLASLQP